MPLTTMTRLLARLTGAMVVGAAVLAPQAASAGNTLTISPGQSWSSVLSQAQPGDTVVVKQGVHPAQRLIGRDYGGVVVVGESRTATVVQGLYLKDVKNLTVRNLSSAPVGNYDLGAAFKISFASSKITLDDVTAVPRTTTSTAGFDISRGGNVSPSDVVISDAYYNGQYVTGSGGRGVRIWAGNVPADQWPTGIKVIRGKFVNSSADLIQIGGGRNITLADNKLTSPKVTDEHNDGIQTYGSDGLIVRGNTISAPGSYVGSDQGIILGHSSPDNAYLKVTNSLVEGNTVDAWRGQGITIAGTEKTTIRDNTVANLNSQASSMVVGPGQWNYQNTGAAIYDNDFGKLRTIGDTAGVTFTTNRVLKADRVAR